MKVKICFNRIVECNLDMYDFLWLKIMKHSTPKQHPTFNNISNFWFVKPKIIKQFLENIFKTLCFLKKFMYLMYFRIYKDYN